MAPQGAGPVHGTVAHEACMDQMQTSMHLRSRQATPSAIGSFVESFRGHRLLAHNGSTMAGFSSVPYHYPEDRFTMIVLCNIDPGAAVYVVATHVASFSSPGVAIDQQP